MKKKNQLGLDWLERECKRDEMEIKRSKAKIINEIKSSLTKEKVAEEYKPKRNSFWNKLKKIFGK